MTTVTEYIHLVPHHSKCASFDMDDTLIYSSSSEFKPVPNGPETVRKIHDNGYNIIVFSNQLKPKLTNVIVNKKIQAVIKHYSIEDIPLHFLCSREKDQYRKPEIGMISLLPKAYGNIEFFVGDADGSTGSHSDCDKAFATNAEIKFFTPEQFFNQYPTISRNEPYPNIGKFLTLTLLIGYPASGKTTYATNVLTNQNVFRISRDELRTMNKCMTVAKKKLYQNIDVVIDNLNTSNANRERWIKLAEEVGAQVVVIYFTTPIHRAMVWNDNREKNVPTIVFYKFRKEFVFPRIEEGIDKIYSVVD